MEADADIGVDQTASDAYTFSKLPADNVFSQIDNVDFSDNIMGGGVAVDNIRSVIFSPTGRCKGPSIYITIGNATYINGYWTPKKAGTMRNTAGDIVNESCADQFTLEINRYTGTITYLLPIDYR